MFYNKSFSICCLLLYISFSSFHLYSESLSILGSRLTAEKNGFTVAPNSNKGKIPSILQKYDPCSSGIRCIPLISCPAHIRMKPHERPKLCELPDETHGYCCVTGQKHAISSSKLRSHDFVSSPQLISAVMAQVKANLEAVMNHKSRAIQRTHPEFLHSIMFRSSPRDILKTIDLSTRAIEQVFASRVYKEKEHISIEEFQLNMLKVPLNGTPLGRNCPEIPECHNIRGRYRSPDGVCNNIQNLRTVWGAAGQPMERILPPSYEDGIWSPRIHSVDGSLLKSARTISRKLLPDNYRPHSRYNLLLMQFGQFISHDLTQSSSLTLDDGQAVQCCSDDGSRALPPESRHYACFPIAVEADDEFYKTYNQGCLNFVRSSLAPHYDCRLGYGKQLSKVTHYLDGSVVYGSDSSSQAEVRSFRDGKLRMFDDFGRDLLPLTQDQDACSSIKSGNACFLSGDGRTNQIISLTALHVIFAREHNRIAEILSHLNPHYTDEIIFQETKRLVTAEMQHITYSEWLPLVIGTEAMKQFGISPLALGYSFDYDAEVNAAITNEFSGAAFRFGHSTVDGKLKIHREGAVDEIVDIPDVMFNPTRLRQRDYLDDMLNTLLQQPMQECDSSITFGLSRFLFRGGNPFGLDLAALNIQRGRDHGLRPYNDYLEVSGNQRIKDFSELGPEVGAKLSEVYNSPDDIDLWVGGLLEPAHANSLLGRTFGQIIADQFSRLKRGDRYFYENHPNINPGHFTPDQLREIRKVTLSRILCDNADHHSLFTAPVHSFLRTDLPENTPVDCHGTEIPSVNLQLWKD